ncbi:MAG: Crp/Fnr family transcriptional regulator [Cyanobacteria bacterium J06554_6]
MTYFFKYAADGIPADRANVCTFKRREPLPKRHLWKIHAGAVRVVTWDDEGNVMPLGFWEEGSLIGGVLVVAEPCEILALTTVTAERLSPSTIVPAATFVAQSRQTAELLKILHCRQVDSRLLQLVRWLLERFGDSTPEGESLSLRMTHQEIAEAIGSTRVTVTRTLKQLEANGYLRRVGAGKIIFDRALWARSNSFSERFHR